MPGFDARRKGYYHDGKSFAQMAQQYAPECLALWTKAMNDEDAPWNIRVRASELIVERAYGKAASVIDMQVTHNRPLTALTDDELLRIITAEPGLPALTLDGAFTDYSGPDLAVQLPVARENFEEIP